MSNFPIVDTHLHLWDPQHIRYPWLASVPLLNKKYLLDDYKTATESLNIERMVFLQCEADFSQFQKEAEWVTELAETDRRIEGIVPWAPLEKGRAARPDLERFVENKLIKGIRRIIQFEPDPEFCLKRDFIDGVRLLPEFNFNFDICIAHHQMANTLKFVRQCPDVKFILDHIGKPDICHQVFEPWKTHLKELAAMPNVWCKMSGLVVEADMQKWKPADLRPYIDHVLDCFGFDRVMFGGDWPVVLQASSYTRWVETLQAAVSECTEEEKRKLFHDNAIEFYRLVH